MIDNKVLKLYNPTAAKQFVMQSQKIRNEQDRSNIFLDSYGTFCMFLTVYGVFPITGDRRGIFKFNLWSPRAAYSSVILLSCFAFSAYIFLMVLENFRQFKMSFSQKLFYSFNLVYPIIFPIHLLRFFETCKMAKYLTDWTDFQARFEKVTKRPLPKIPSIMKQIILIGSWFIATLLIFVCLIIKKNVEVIEEHDLNKIIHYSAFLIYFFSTGLFLLHTLHWLLLSMAVFHASKHLIQEIESLRWTNSGKLEEYEMLWHNLRQQCEGMGSVLSWSYLYTCALLFTISIPFLYLGVNGNPILLFTALNPLLFITILAEVAHRTSDQVGEKFRDKLTRLALSGRAVGHEQQLMAFAQTVVLNRPTIALSQYFNLDRGINLPLYSSVVTYFIVIAQFKPDLGS